jgi:ferredoxin
MARRRELRNEWTKKEIDDQLGEFKVVTVPIDIRFEGSQKVLSFSEAEKILRGAKLISLEACTCREKMGNCDSPVDDICIGVDKGAEEAINLRSGRKATLEESMAVLRRTHSLGLVHLSFELEGHKMSAICSCCECCCHAMAAMSRFGGYEGLVNPSDMVASHSDSLCSSCGICVEKCQFEAWRMVGGKARHYPGRCTGCGVCVSFCPEMAIALVRRQA